MSEHIGGRKIHSFGVFKQNLKIKCECENCSNKFIATFNKNHIALKAELYIDQTFYPDTDCTSSYITEGCIQHFSVCPHCEHKEELFCENL